LHVTGCIFQPPPSTSYTSYLYRAGMEQPQRMEGRAQISRNGRFLLQHYGGMTILHDFDRGREWAVPLTPVWPGRAVTRDGKVLGRSAPGSPVVLWQSSEPDTVTTLPDPACTDISDDGRVVLCARGASGLVRIPRAAPSAQVYLARGRRRRL
jgi:hypothetical protein